MRAEERDKARPEGVSDKPLEKETDHPGPELLQGRVHT